MHATAVVDLAREENFYVDNIRGITQDPGELIGLLTFSPSCLIAFSFFRLTTYMPIRNHSTCLVDLKYILVSHRMQRMNVGSALLDRIRVHAEEKFPGANILVEVESKPSTSAKRFWFKTNGFVEEQGVSEEKVIPGSRTYDPMPLLAHLGIRDPPTPEPTVFDGESAEEDKTTAEGLSFDLFS